MRGYNFLGSMSLKITLRFYSYFSKFTFLLLERKGFFYYVIALSRSQTNLLFLDKRGGGGVK
jgi:hypothetical protein